MNKSKELYNEYVANTKAWLKSFDTEPNPPKGAKGKALDRFFETKKYTTWLNKEEALNKKVRASHEKLYKHLTKSGLKMDKFAFNRMLSEAVYGRGNVADQLRAKAKIKLIVNTVGRNDLKSKAKYKLPSQNQLSRGCGRR